MGAMTVCTLVLSAVLAWLLAGWRNNASSARPPTTYVAAVATYVALLVSSGWCGRRLGMPMRDVLAFLLKVVLQFSVMRRATSIGEDFTSSSFGASMLGQLLTCMSECAEAPPVSCHQRCRAAALSLSRALRRAFSRP